MHKSSFNKSQLYSAFLFLLSCAVIAPAFAIIPEITSNTEIKNNIIQDIKRSYNTEESAKAWGLTIQDFKHYQWLMQHTPSSHWYKNLDPAEVLALNTDNRSDMMKYAKIQARNMHIRVLKELTFDATYSRAYKMLYPKEKPISSQTPRNFHNNALQPGDRIWLFLKVDTPLGRFVYKNLIKIIQKTPDVVLDIYFVGKETSTQAIKIWASNVGIPLTAINKQVTLNYGKSRLKAISEGKRINLPFVGIIHNKHFQPITLSSLL